MKKVALSFISLILASSLAYSANCGTCLGCTSFWVELGLAAQDIDYRHYELEVKLNNYYQAELIPLLKEVELLQLDLTKLTAHIELMEKEAVINEKEIIVYLGKALKHNIQNEGGKK